MGKAERRRRGGKEKKKIYPVINGAPKSHKSPRRIKEALQDFATLPTLHPPTPSIKFLSDPPFPKHIICREEGRNVSVRDWKEEGKEEEVLETLINYFFLIKRSVNGPEGGSKQSKKKFHF